VAELESWCEDRGPNPVSLVTIGKLSPLVIAPVECVRGDFTNSSVAHGCHGIHANPTHEFDSATGACLAERVALRFSIA